MLSNTLEPSSLESIASFKLWEQACAKRVKRSKIFRYILHSIWIPLVIYLATLSYL